MGDFSMEKVSIICDIYYLFLLIYKKN